MQISGIVLYSNDGEKHHLPFDIGRVNIVTGRSARGKSAILAVVDYCLGARRLGVPAGAIQNSVSWYGLAIQLSGEYLFLARPGDGKGVWHIGREIVDFGKLDARYSREDLLSKISSLLGIQTTMVARADGRFERRAVTARSSLIYCFQKQNEIANQDLFFHRQSEPGVSQSIRDFLPYYLGAVSERVIEQQLRLKEKKKRLKEIDLLVGRMESVESRRDEEASYLIAEAERVGALEKGRQVDSPAQTIDVLLEAEGKARAVPKDLTQPISEIHEKIENAQLQRIDVRREIEALSAFSGDQDLYASGVNEQKLRLKSIGIMPPMEQGDHCPLCWNELANPLPTVQEVSRSLRQLNDEISFVTRDKGATEEALAKKRMELKDLDEALIELRRQIARMRSEEKEAAAFFEQRNEVARVGGMIHMFLRVAGIDSDQKRKELIAERSALISEIEDIEADLNSSSVDTRVATFLGGVGQTVTRWAREQALEYADGFLTFDLRGPAFVSEGSSGRIPFSRFGSGKNWVWYHILGHMALHKWFIENDRPTPRFLILDQPSQVYFPSDDGEGEAEDLEEVRRIYNWLFDAVEGLEGQMQVIVTDHAHFLQDKKFLDHVKHDWWETNGALVPLEWLPR